MSNNQTSKVANCMYFDLIYVGLVLMLTVFFSE